MQNCRLSIVDCRLVCAPHSALRTPHSAFTLVEVLATIVIIALLLGILIPAVGKFQAGAEKSAANYDLNAIAMAVKTYGTDFNRYQYSYLFGEADNYGWPGKPNGINDDQFANPYEHSNNEYYWDGGDVLTQMMMGHVDDDGKTGEGFRKGSTGRVYGPYYQPNDNVRMRPRWDKDGGGGQNGDEWYIASGQDYSAAPSYVFTDYWDQPILYYRARRFNDKDPTRNDDNVGSDGKMDDADDDLHVWGPRGRFRTYDNNRLLRLHENSNGTAHDLVTNYIRNKAPASVREDLEKQLRTSDYLLVSFGLDGDIGTEDDIIVPGP